MEFIPAIDLMDGKVVRLHKGDYAQVTVYSDNPAEQVRRFHAAGARRVHIVDLDGAREGRPCNLATMQRMLAAAPVAIQVGGGVRDATAAERWFEAGAARVVLGTAAVKQPELVRSLCAAHPGGIVVAVDARHGEVAVEGWLEGTGVSALDLARRADGWGAAALLHTAIERDGTREGPDVAATAALQAQVAATVIASGGIGTLEHLRQLVAAGVRSTVCGKALYSGAFELHEAFAVCGAQPDPAARD
jgi:phosphoribosylformimino-5-aminoimidazole carboxamide ribotide isomerase